MPVIKLIDDLQTQLTGYQVILIFVIGGLAFLGLTLLQGRILRPVRPNHEKLTTYESGEDPVKSAWGNFNVRFYVIALIFLLFEVELLFLFPWAIVFGDSQLIEDTDGAWGWFAFTEMFLFIFVLALGLFYAWSKGFLNWELPKDIRPDFKGLVDKAHYESFNQKMDTK